MFAKKIMASVVMPAVTALGVFSGGGIAAAGNVFDDGLTTRDLVLDRVLENKYENRLFDDDLFDDRDRLFTENRRIIIDNDRFDDDRFITSRRLNGVVTTLDRDQGNHAVWVRLGNGQVVRVLVDNDTRFGFDNGFDGLRNGDLLDLDCDRFGNGFRALSIDRDISIDQDIDIDRDINHGISF